MCVVRWSGVGRLWTLALRFTGSSLFLSDLLTGHGLQQGKRMEASEFKERRFRTRLPPFACQKPSRFMESSLFPSDLRTGHEPRVAKATRRKAGASSRLGVFARALEYAVHGELRPPTMDVHQGHEPPPMARQRLGLRQSSGAFDDPRPPKRQRAAALQDLAVVPTVHGKTRGDLPAAVACVLSPEIKSYTFCRVRDKKWHGKNTEARRSGGVRLKGVAVSAPGLGSGPGIRGWPGPGRVPGRENARTVPSSGPHTAPSGNRRISCP
jgi:hypothetical protein